MSTPDPEQCPKCNASSQCVHWEQVHNGVGYEYYDHHYECPGHGEFVFLARSFHCKEHDECKANEEMSFLCERSKPGFVFKEDVLHKLPAPYFMDTKVRGVE